MQRVKIGKNFKARSIWSVFIGMPFIYLPLIIIVPFIILAIVAVKIHLKYLGATNIKPFLDFVPTWISHRYIYKNQIVYETNSSWRNWRSYRFF